MLRISGLPAFANCRMDLFYLLLIGHVLPSFGSAACVMRELRRAEMSPE